MSHVTYKWVMLLIRHKSSLIPVSYVTYEWIMSQMNKSCLKWISTVWYESKTQCVMSHLDGSCHVWMSHVTYEWVVSLYEGWVMSHMNGSCRIWMNKSCPIWANVPYELSHVMREWVLIKTCMSHMNESCNVWIGYVTYEGVMSHKKKSYQARMSF